jgi:hydroxymethylbilane synthase
MSAASPLLRIATRQSALALWQAQHVAAQLRAAHPRLQVRLVPMTTQGDRVLDRPLADVGGKGLFVKALEVALAAGRADIAVHSMKDVPSELPPGMTLAAMLARADPSDAFVSLEHTSFDALPHGARVGTSSPRRQCQLKHARPDLDIVALRGNVDTRLRKLEAKSCDAIVLASAGLVRLGLEHRITHRFDFARCVPAVGQGIIGIECRSDDARAIDLASALDDPISRCCCESERAFALRLQGSCHSPIAGFAEVSAGQLRLRGIVGSPDGRTVYSDSVQGSPTSAIALGIELAERLLSAGAAQLLDSLRR